MRKMRASKNCANRGHDWEPTAKEFCLRCGRKRVLYNAEGHVIRGHPYQPNPEAKHRKGSEEEK
jgi:hypothetical protein